MVECYKSRNENFSYKHTFHFLRFPKVWSKQISYNIKNNSKRIFRFVLVCTQLCIYVSRDYVCMGYYRNEFTIEVPSSRTITLRIPEQHNKTTFTWAIFSLYITIGNIVHVSISNIENDCLDRERVTDIVKALFRP